MLVLLSFEIVGVYNGSLACDYSCQSCRGHGWLRWNRWNWPGVYFSYARTQQVWRACYFTRLSVSVQPCTYGVHCPGHTLFTAEYGVRFRPLHDGHPPERSPSFQTLPVVHSYHHINVKSSDPRIIFRQIVYAPDAFFFRIPILCCVVSKPERFKLDWGRK